MDADVDSAWISTQAIVSADDIQPDNEREKIHDYGCIVLNGMVDNGRYILKEGDNTIGRHPLNDIYIEHPSVSMNHAVIQCDSDGVVLLDKGSLNKTKLNKKNLRKDVAYFLEENALLMFGEVQADYFINGESNEVTNNSKSIASDNISAHKATQNDELSLSKLSNTVNTSKSFRTDIPNAITDFNVSLIRNSSKCQTEKEVSQTITGSESAMNTLNDIHTELNSSSPSDEYLLEALSQVETIQNNIHSNKIINNLSNKDTSIINPTESMPKITREDTPSPVMDLGSSFVTTNKTPGSIFQSPNKFNTELIREDTPSPVMDLGSSFVTTNKTPENIFQSPNKINTELIREDTPSPVMDFGCYNDFENKLETDNHDVIAAIQSPNEDDKFNNTQVLEIPNLKSENVSISINESFGQKQNVSMNNFKNSFDADDDDILFCESQKVESGDQSSIPTTHVFDVPSNYNLSSSININSNKQYSEKPAEPLNITKKSGIHNDGLNNDFEQNRLTLTRSNLKSVTEGHNIDKHKRNVNTFEADDDDIFSNFIEEECKSQQQNLNLLENQDFFNCPTQKISIPKKVNEKPKISSSIHEEKTQKPPELAKLSKTKTSTSNIDSNGINGDLTEVFKKDNEDFFDCPTQKLTISKKINSKSKVPSTIHKEEIQKVFEFSKPSNNNLIVSKSYSTSIHEDLTQIPEMDDDFFNCPTQKISIPRKVNEKPNISSSIHEEETQKPTEFTQLSKIKASTSNGINEDLTEILKIDNEDFFDCPTQKLSITKRVNSKPKVSSTIHEQETQNILEFLKPSKNDLTALKKHSTSIHEELTQIPEMDDDFFNCPTQKISIPKKVNEKPKMSSSINKEETQKPTEFTQLSKIKASTSNIDSNGINEDLTDVLKIDNEDFFDCPTQKLSITKKVHLKPKVSSTIHDQETQNILEFSKPSKNDLTTLKKHSTHMHEELTQIPEMDDDFFNCPTQKYALAKKVNEKPIISSSIHEEETQKPPELAKLSKTKTNTSSNDSNSINEDLTDVLKIDNEDFFDCPTQKLSITKKVHLKPKVSSTIHDQETQNILEFSKPSKNNLTVSKKYSTSINEELTQIPEMDDDFFNCPTQKYTMSKNINEKPKMSSSIHEEETQKPSELAHLSKTKTYTSSIDSTSINENLTAILEIDNGDFFDCPTQKLSTIKQVKPKSKVSSTIHEQETQNILEFSKPNKNNLTVSKNYSISVQEDLTQIPEMDDDFFNCPTQKISISKNIVEKPKISNSIHEEETQNPTELVQFNNIKTNTSSIDSTSINENLTEVLKIDNEDFFDCPTQKLSTTKKVNPKSKVSSTIHEQETQNILEFSKPNKNNLTVSKNYSTSVQEDLTQIPEMDDDFFNRPTQKISISKNIVEKPKISNSIHEEETQKPTELVQFNNTKTSISNTDSINIKKELTKVLKIDNDDFFNCPTQKLSFTKNTDLKPKVSSTVHDEVTQELIDKPIENIESTSNSNTISKHTSSIQVPEIDNDFFNCPTQNISNTKKINLLANVSTIANKENTQKPAEFSQLNKTNTNISKTDFTNKHKDFNKLNNHKQAIEPDNKNRSKVQKSKCINSNTIDLSNVQLPVCNDNSSNSLKINKPKIRVREDLCISYSGNSSNSTNILNKPNENTVMKNITTVPILKNINLPGCSKTSTDRETDLNTLSSIKQEHLTDDYAQSRVSISRKHNDRLKRMDESIFSPLNIPDISANSLLEHHSSSKTVEDNLNALNCKPSTSGNDASVWKSFWNKKKVQCQVKGKSDKQGNSKITHEVKENKERYQTRAMTRKENASILNRKRKQDGVEESNKKICTRKKILESLVENSTETVVSFSYLKSRHLQEMKQFVDKTGGTVTDEITECSVLVTDKIRCTMKILSAIARGCPIVNTNWLKHSYTVQMFQDIDDFLIVDKDAERKYKFQLKESLAKAKTKKLLDGYNVLVTPSVKPSPQEMKVIISCAGGNYVLNWTNTQYSKELIVTCDKDRNRWKPAWDNDFAKIIDSDTLVTSIIRQKLTL